jgi:RNA polymerase sigma factor (TIGR02999 family)
VSGRHAAGAEGAGEVTLVLNRLRAGDEGTLARLIELIHPELRKLAQRHFRHERPGHVLQPTALVNEAYLRLVGHRQHRWQNRAHFFAAASNLMRRILVEHARARKTLKRTDVPSMQDDAVHGASERDVEDLLALDAALEALEELSSRQAQIVQLRYFGGLSVPEAAEVLGVTPRTVDRDWAAARAWLRIRLQP